SLFRDKRSHAEEAMHHLGEGEQQEQGEHAAEMQGEQRRYDRGTGGGIESKTRHGYETQKADERHLTAPNPHGAERRIRFGLQVCQADRADRQQDASRDAEQLRQAEEAVRRFHAEAVMQDRARSSRAEAEQETIEDCLMQMTRSEEHTSEL